MKGVFVELPAFERHRTNYLDDEAFQSLQSFLMKDPSAGDPIPGPEGCENCDSPMCGGEKEGGAGSG